VARQRLLLWLSVSLAACGLLLAGVFPFGNPDTYGHLAAGRQICELGRVPDSDSFSFFRETSQPWRNYEWLSDLVFWGAYAALGENGLLALKLMLLGLLAFLLLRRAWQERGESGAICCGILLLFAIPSVRFRLTVRPHLFGMLFGALFLVGLPAVARGDDDERATRLARWWVGLLVLAQLLWVNLHGSNLLGLALTAIYLAVSLRSRIARNRLLLLLGLQLGACCVTPFGPFILLDSVAHLANPAYRELVDEWLPWSAAHHPLWLLAAPLVQAALLALALPVFRRRGPQGWASLGIAVLLGLMAFRSIRFVGEFMLLSAPLLAAAASELLSRCSSGRRAALLFPLTALACVVALLAASALPPRLPLAWGRTTRILPAGSASWLRDERPDARILAAMEDSWYLMFALPRARFLVDGRTPFYGADHIRLVVRSIRSPSLLRETLDRFGVDTVVVQHSFRGHQQMLRAMRGLESWALVMIEDRHAVFARERPGGEFSPGAHALDALVPAYEAGFVLDPAADTAALRRELARLSGRPNTSGYAGWVKALLQLRPLARSGGKAGLREPENKGERRAAASALQDLRSLAEKVTDVPSIEIHLALAALSLCRLDEARRALERASAEGGSREALLLGQEIALRQGREPDVRDFLQRARSLQGTEDDPWLDALDDMLRTPPRCGKGAASTSE
jgi:hypothetical protein